MPPGIGVAFRQCLAGFGEALGQDAQKACEKMSALRQMVSIGVVLAVNVPFLSWRLQDAEKGLFRTGAVLQSAGHLGFANEERILIYLDPRCPVAIENAPFHKEVIAGAQARDGKKIRTIVLGRQPGTELESYVRSNGLAPDSVVSIDGFDIEDQFRFSPTILRVLPSGRISNAVVGGVSMLERGSVARRITE